METFKLTEQAYHDLVETYCIDDPLPLSAVEGRNIPYNHRYHASQKSERGYGFGPGEHVYDGDMLYLVDQDALDAALYDEFYEMEATYT